MSDRKPAGRPPSPDGLIARRDPLALTPPLYVRVFGSLDLGSLRALLGPPTEGCLADVGGGTGRVARALADLAGQVVVDPSAALGAEVLVGPTRRFVARLAADKPGGGPGLRSSATNRQPRPGR